MNPQEKELFRDELGIAPSEWNERIANWEKNWEKHQHLQATRKRTETRKWERKKTYTTMFGGCQHSLFG